MPGPTQDVAAYLIASSPLGGVTLTTANCFAGPFPAATGVPAGSSAVPSLAIGCVQSAGNNVPIIGAGGGAIQEPQVNVHVRSAGESFTAGELLAREAQVACNAVAPSGYIGWWSSEPVYAGADDTGAHHWLFTIRCVFN